MQQRGATAGRRPAGPRRDRRAVVAALVAGVALGAAVVTRAAVPVDEPPSPPDAAATAGDAR